MAARRQAFMDRIDENQTEAGPRDEYAALQILAYRGAVECLDYLIAYLTLA